MHLPALFTADLPLHGTTALVLFLAAALAGAITTGLAGFAFGLVVSGVWLHIITPLQTTTLIVFYGLLVQSYGIWKMRHAFDWRHVLPLILGGVVGVPIGVALLAYANPDYLRSGVGLLLIAYSVNGLARPAVKPVSASVPAELAIGVVNGLLGGMTGLSGVFVTVWCSMRGWTKDLQRAVYQPVIFAAAVITAGSLAAGGHVDAPAIALFLTGLPVLLIGLWIGMRLYGHLDEVAFRRTILVLLLISGLVLVVPELLLLRR
jgi:uncharacterized membrane protein YfcA